MKKIYIHTDLEGISGIGCADMVNTDYNDYDYSIERLMADVNAAVDGAFLGGAEHVTVLDSHGGGGNFDRSMLDSRADFDEKSNGKWWGKVDDTYCGTFFIGAHAMAGTINGFLDHTQDSTRILNYCVNGRNMGELAQWAMVCAHYNVPVIMVSGDEAAVNEAIQFFGNIEVTAVKRGISRRKAILVPNDTAVENIRQACKKAVERTDIVPLFKPILPMEVRLDLTRTDYCEDYLSANPNYERLNARTIRMISDSYQNFI